MKRAFTVVLSIVALCVATLAVLGFTSNLSTDIPPGFRGEYQKVAGINLRVWQQGEGQDVLLIHGLPGSIESWDTVTEKLAKHYRVTVYDRPGHGFSEYKKELSNLADNVRVAYALVEKMGLENVIVVGHSYGGSMVTAMANNPHEQISGYLSIAGVVESDGDVAPIYHLLNLPAIGAGFAKPANDLLGKTMMRNGVEKAFAPNPVPEGFIEKRDDMWLSVKSSLTFAHEQTNYPQDLSRLSYSNLSLPFRILHGKQDATVPLTNAYAIKKSNPGTLLAELDSTGHMLQFVHPDAVIKAVNGLSKSARSRTDTHLN